MVYYDEQLQKLQQQIAEKERLDAVLKQLEKHKRELERRVVDLDVARESEQADVDRLEGRSLANFFYRATGKMGSRLDKEKQEAYAAAVKYDAAVRELEAAKADLQKYRAEYAPLRDSRKRYEELLEQKAASIKSSGVPEGEQILHLEEQIAFLESQKKEIAEARDAGESACSIVDSMLSELDSAKGWGTWDMLGGGLVADLAKHSHLDSAQDKVERLQIQLDRFRTELTDVTIQTNLQVNVDGFLRFADYFFDGLFVDWTVLNRIQESLEETQNLRKRIEDVLDQLDNIRTSAQKEQNRMKAQLNQLVLNTPLQAD